MRDFFRKYGRYAGYGLFTLVMILYFTVLTFPYDVLKDRYLARQTQGMPYRVTVESIRATPFLWIRASGIDVTREKKEKTSLVKLRELRLRPSLFRLLTGQLAFRFKADLYGGKIRGSARRGKESAELSVNWKNISVAKLPLQTQLPGAQLKGKFNGEMDLLMRIQGNRVVPSEGVLKARLEDASAANLQFKGIALPGLKDIKGNGEITVGQNRATVDTLTLQADVLSVSLDGRMDLTRSLTTNPLNLKGKIKLSGPLASQYQPMLAGFLRKQDKDGFYVFSVRGTLSSPRLSL